MNVLKRQGRITIQEVVERFGVSEATARRDLELMEKAEPVIRTIGGAMYDGLNAVRELPFAEKEGLCFLEKERIAAAAAGLIAEGDVVGLSGGTTNYYLAKLLKTRRGITVVTNTVNVAMELAGSDINVVVTGGMMRHNSFELCGPLGEGMVAQLNIGKMFLGVDGVSSTGGITTYSRAGSPDRQSDDPAFPGDLRHVRSYEDRADFAVLDRVLAELQGFITDRELPQQLASIAHAHGIQTVIASAWHEDPGI